MSTAIPARTSPRASVDHPEVELQRLEASEPLLNAEDDTTVAEMTPKTKSAWGDRRETIATYLILVSLRSRLLCRVDCGSAEPSRCRSDVSW